MRSSTSGSSASTSRDFVILLLVIALLVAGLEIAARFVVPARSAGIARITRDLQDARRPSSPSRDRPTILVVGNSLLLDGVDRPALVSGLQDDAEVRLLPMEGTMFNDWYFGLKRLFDTGSNPDIVILCINSQQMLASGTNGTTFARFLMRLRDLPDVIRESHLNMMQASEYALAHWSFWLATRSNVRIGVLERSMPFSKALVPHFIKRGAPPPAFSASVGSTYVHRLRLIQGLVESHGARFAWLIPPTLDAKDFAPLVADFAAAEGFRVLVPYAPGEMPSQSFADGFHLNADGAAAFTSRAEPELRMIARGWANGEDQAGR